MSGHSHAANIAAKKAKTDAAKGKIFTKVGREILEGKNERENIIKQILTLQIPNAYFLDSSFRITFLIRPCEYSPKSVNDSLPITFTPIFLQCVSM